MAALVLMSDLPPATVMLLRGEGCWSIAELIAGLVPGAMGEAMSSVACYEGIQSKKGTWDSCHLQETEGMLLQ